MSYRQLRTHHRTHQRPGPPLAGGCVLLVVLWAAACAPPATPVATPVATRVERPAPEEAPVVPSPVSSRELVRAMHDRYSGKWYHTLRFEQANTFYAQSGREEKSRWVQNMSVPGKLRIDFHPLSSKSGMLILNNRVTTFDKGRRLQTRRSVQPILTLTADVYAIPAAITIRRLDSLGLDLAKFRKARWEKKGVYVMGAREGDLESNQVWIDAERLVLVRLIQRETREGRTIVTDTRVGEYREVDGFPVAFEYLSFRDGKPYFREQYEKLRVNEPIPAVLFDPTKWESGI